MRRAGGGERGRDDHLMWKRRVNSQLQIIRWLCVGSQVLLSLWEPNVFTKTIKAYNEDNEELTEPTSWSPDQLSQ